MIFDELEQHPRMVELLQILRIISQPCPDLLDESDLAEDLHPLGVNRQKHLNYKSRSLLRANIVSRDIMIGIWVINSVGG